MHVSRETTSALLAYAEAGEDLIEHVLGIDSAGDAAERGSSTTQVFCAQLRLMFGTVEKALQGLCAVFEMAAMAGLGDNGFLACR